MTFIVRQQTTLSSQHKLYSGQQKKGNGLLLIKDNLTKDIISTKANILDYTKEPIECTNVSKVSASCTESASRCSDNHIGTGSNSNIIKMEECKMLKVEMIKGLPVLIDTESGEVTDLQMGDNFIEMIRRAKAYKAENIALKEENESLREEMGRQAHRVDMGYVVRRYNVNVPITDVNLLDADSAIKIDPFCGKQVEPKQIDFLRRNQERINPDLRGIALCFENQMRMRQGQEMMTKAEWSQRRTDAFQKNRSK